MTFEERLAAVQFVGVQQTPTMNIGIFQDVVTGSSFGVLPRETVADGLRSLMRIWEQAEQRGVIA